MGFFHHHEKSSDNPPAYQGQQQQQAYQQSYQSGPPQPGPYPFSIFSPPQDPNHIVFTIADLGKGHDALVSPNHSPANPAYRIEYTSDGFKCLRTPLPSLDPRGAVLAGSAISRKNTTSTAGRVHLEYPWGKWDYNPLSPATELWKSDVGLLNGTSGMSWHLIKPVEAQTTGRFAVRCFDTAERGYPTVASFEMENWDFGVLSVHAGVVRSQQQLDEIVVLSFAVMDYIRVVIRSTGGVQKRPGGGNNNDKQFWMTMALSQQAQNQQAQGN
ncbi:hypothetical protein M406DRAFT_356936 [Cryphonectria parasitica EP155]|uniref:Uncharacterized protein n=1 Tax=Cryphonectria parasitica (strain ATCC 38755 / EP155) TaxID=660469 RepID=A0A9P4XY99_CRYP1|nr:uncharacterized protein M406DRAFT_356936 [Cryphonectria parasitica EP155]KAF3763118.1 hypothetical protein M406DRAFT_356936 [Cryphonectria parasitica EP155]